MQFYRQALAVFSGDPLPDLCHRLVSTIKSHGLAALWYARTGCEEFRLESHAISARYLAQRRVMVEVGAMLDAAAIPYAFFKGCAVRERAWPDPSFRPALDIDILVPPAARDRVIIALLRADFSHAPTPPMTHETSLSRGGVEIDLHWGIHRPGKYRRAMEPGILDRREHLGGLAMASHEDCFRLALVMTAFGDYATAATAGLHRMADLLSMMDKQPPDWHAVRESLACHGACTAAWCTVKALSLVAPDRFRDMIATGLHALRPAPLHRRYLTAWIEADLPKTLCRHHWIRQVAFSLVMHDTPADAWRASKLKLATVFASRAYGWPRRSLVLKS